MGLTRKLRKVGHSLTISLPAQLAALMEWTAGDEIEFDYLGNGTLRVRKRG